MSAPITHPEALEAAGIRSRVGVHLVGSVPLAGVEDVLRTVASGLGDRVRRIPDGETGPRSDWIVWQLPLLCARHDVEVLPPAPGAYRALPRVSLKAGVDPASVRFEALGYAEAAEASYRVFARLKRDGLIPVGVRFQVSLPTPLAPIGAFVAAGDQAALERPYEERMLAEVTRILEVVPPEQLAIQWDTNFEFGMLEGVFPVWFTDVKGGILERLLRLSRHVPPEVELGYHLCYGEGERRDFKEPQDAHRLVEIANALAASLDRPLNWIHLPVPRAREDDAYYEPLALLRLRPETELYLGLVHHTDGVEGTARRMKVASRYVDSFGIATECGWGRRAPGTIGELVNVHRELSEPVQDTTGVAEPFRWPDGFERIPDEEWTHQPLDSFGLAYDTVERHGWYSNLDLTVEALAGHLRDGQLLIDYSGGTGILLDRLRLRIFTRQVGVLIVDSSPKFLRVALEKFRADRRVALRLIRWLKEQRRLQYMDEVVGRLDERGADALVSTNAIHLYTDLPGTLASWSRVLRGGSRGFVNSGNVRNPQARPDEWVLDEPVWVIQEIATGLVRNDGRYAAYRHLLDDEERMARHLAFRDRVFVPVRSLDYYVKCFEDAGFRIEDVSARTIRATLDDWFELLGAYHEAVLGWVGGTLKVDGRDPEPSAVEDRLQLMRHSLDVLFGGRREFNCCWTYITFSKP